MWLWCGWCCFCSLAWISTCQGSWYNYVTCFEDHHMYFWQPHILYFCISCVLCQPFVQIQKALVFQRTNNSTIDVTLVWLVLILLLGSDFNMPRELVKLCDLFRGPPHAFLTTAYTLFLYILCTVPTICSQGRRKVWKSGCASITWWA